MKNSPISKITLEGREFFVKRDDLIDPYLCGNKYRKLFALINTPKKTFNKLISYGGTQSNAMLALAALAKEKEWEFIYYTKPLSEVQKQQKIQDSNFFHAINLGMQHRQINEKLYKDFIASLRINLEEKSFIVDQGGALEEARDGVEVLAQEIREAKLDVRCLATPSGTGTTALFLALAMPEYIIYTTPSVGDVEYLREQMSALEKIPDNLIILKPEKKFHFAKPYQEFISIYEKLLGAGVEFDLLYAPLMWKTLLEQTEEKILYIHSGGVSGNKSMFKRYEKKGFI